MDEYYSVIFTILKIHLGTLSQNVKPAEFKQTLEELKYVFYQCYALFQLYQCYQFCSKCNIIFADYH